MKTLRKMVALSAALAALAGPARASAGVISTYEGILLHPTSGGSRLLGLAVAVDGDTAVVGVPGDAGGRGSVQVFVREGGNWIHQASLTHPTPETGDQFGARVAMHGDTVVVAVVGDRTPFSPTGSAQVYVRNGTTWSHQAELLHHEAPTFFGTNTFFGSSVAVHGDVALVGAPRDFMINPAGLLTAGTVQVYVRAGNVWTYQTELFDPAVLTDPESARDDLFGSSVALDGATAIVGQSRDDTRGTDAGAAHLFATDSWTHLARLTSPDGAAFDQFGASVAVSGDRVIVGALFDGTAAGPGAGSAHVFVQGVHEATLLHPSGSSGDQFGTSVAIGGDMAIIGAPADDVAGISGGVDAGSVHVFSRSGTTWAHQDELQHPFDVSGGGGDQFGWWVAFDGRTTVIGAPRDNNVNGSDAGSAFAHPIVLPTTATTTTLASSVNPSLVGEPVTYTATVAPGGATGAVAFMEDGAPISGCTAQPLDSGTATCTVGHATPGNRALVAEYDGDAEFAGSVSAPLTQTVLAATTLTLSSSPNPSVPGEAVTLTVVVTSEAGVAAGAITFTAGGSVLGSSAVGPGGVVTFTIATLPVGTTTVVAQYGGDATHTPSTGSTTHVVDAPPDCSAAAVDPPMLWSPNHELVPVAVMGLTDPDGDPVTVTVEAITQDEPVERRGDGHTCPDAGGVGTHAPSVRAERSGLGNGRVYHIRFTATDPAGAACTGVATVCVPHDQAPGGTCIDEGPLHDSSACP
jgi:hypothetical protein